MQNPEDNYISINKATWNKKVPIHLSSDFYDNANFLKGKSTLNKIELDLLSNMQGKKILHLQCHFGQDSLSLARMGNDVTGVDLSENAVETANSLNAQLGLSAKFICCDVYDLPKNLDEKFDCVFTSYGTIGWLPDIQKWANTVAHFLKPGGQFIFAEFHPVVWMFDNDLEKITYSYFKDEAIIELENGTYADKAADISLESITWNHGMSEVVSAIMAAGLNINTLQEFDYSPYKIFPGMVEYEAGKFRIEKFGNKMPLVYALHAVREK